MMTRHDPIEATAADVAEQERELVPDTGERTPDEGAHPVEADPADVSEQRTVVEIDDEDVP